MKQDDAKVLINKQPAPSAHAAFLSSSYGSPRSLPLPLNNPVLAHPSLYSLLGAWKAL